MAELMVNAGGVDMSRIATFSEAGGTGRQVFKVAEDLGHGFTPPGWYYSRKPDGHAVGPFGTHAEARAAAVESGDAGLADRLGHALKGLFRN